MKSGAVTTIEGEKPIPGMFAITISVDKKGVVDYPVEELDAGRLQLPVWEALRKSKNIKEVRKHQKIMAHTYLEARDPGKKELIQAMIGKTAKLKQNGGGSSPL